jgi:hypothetical protein
MMIEENESHLLPKIFIAIGDSLESPEIFGVKMAQNQSEMSISQMNTVT